MNAYGFRERLAMSHGMARGAQVAEIILRNIPGALNVQAAHPLNDRHGTDYWVEHSSGRHLSVDCKVRAQDWKPRGRDDLAIETWSVIEAGKIGWSRDQDKRTDFVLWFWVDTGRWCLVPFPMLCAVSQARWQEWKARYQTAQQKTPGGPGGSWTSECVFVPRPELWREIYRRFGEGQILATAA
jgi:hypothetical protein